MYQQSMSAQVASSNSHNIVFEGIWIILGKVASFMAMLAMVRFLTEKLDTTEYGKLALGLTLINMVTQLIMGALGQGIGRYYSLALCQGGYSVFVHDSVQLIKKSGVLIGSLGVACVMTAILLGEYQYALFATAIFIYSYLNGLNDIANGLHNLARNRTISVRNATLELLVRLPIVAGVLSVIGSSAVAVVIGYLLSGLVVVGVQYIDLQKLKPARPVSDQNETSMHGNILKMALPASLWGVFVWLQQASDRWALQAYTHTHDVAQYAVIYQIGYTPVIIGIGVLTTLFIPMMYQKKRKDNGLLYRLLFFIFCVTFIGILTTWSMSGWIMSFLASKNYHNAGHFLPYMVLAAGLYSAGDIFSIKMMADIKIKAILVIKITASLLGLAANVIGAYLYGIDGVVYALIFFGFMYFMLFAWVHLTSIIKENVLNV